MTDKLSTFFGHTINVGHLFIACIGIGVVMNGCILRYESRITALESEVRTALEFAKIRNDGQDRRIESNERSITLLQVNVADLSARLDVQGRK